MFQTTAIYENRIRDKRELESFITLPENGSDKIDFYTRNDLLLCKGYERIVYGDHGPYLEFSVYNVIIENWFAKRTGIGYFDKYYPRDNTGVLMYSQRRTVANLPNPPKGKRSFRGNRKEGYADYKIGMYYISPWFKNLKIVRSGIVINNQKCALSDILEG